MIIGGIIAICIVLAILAFLLPRLSHGPQKGVDKTLGAGQSAGGEGPGPARSAVQKPSRLAQGDEQERRQGPRGSFEAAALSGRRIVARRRAAAGGRRPPPI